MIDLALIRQVRVLIADVGTEPLLDDLAIDTYLALNTGADGTPDVRMAAADALRRSRSPRCWSRRRSDQ